MMAWGKECTLWDDSVVHANLKLFGYEDIPDDHFVMTTWHEAEPLSEVLWFAKHAAFHPTIALEHTLLLHISSRDESRGLLQKYADA